MPESLEPDAVVVLARWVGEAEAAGLPLPSTMTLATAGPDGAHARTVLVTAIDSEAGELRFHSSRPTGKTHDLAADPRAAAVFHWPALGRQAVLTGRAGELDDEVSRAAYPTRPRQLQLVAWAYDALLPELTPPYAVAPGAVEAAFVAADADPASAAAPSSWTTIAFTPSRIDFWQAGTPTTPPTRTRYDRTDTGWLSFPVLP
jgi:pyridoxamine 5'-phosphate oxidase